MDRTYPLVTIGIPTYNRSDGYLRETLNSAVNQTYEKVEIIVSDNCSTDNTETFVKGFSDRRVKYIKHKKNIGANNNFNYCLKQAKGAYFLLLHDDDLIDDDFVEICMTTANYTTEYGIIRTGTRVINSIGESLRESRNRVSGFSTEEFFRAWFAEKTSWYLCSTLFNTKKLREIGGFQSKYNLVQDGVALVRLAAKYGIADVEDVKASFRKHPGEITFAVKVKEWCEDYLNLLDLMCDLVGENRDVIRNEGMRFFCKLNYNRASAIESPIKRFMTYMMVYRKFQYSFSPLQYVFSPRVLNWYRHVKKRVKSNLAS